MTKNTKAIAPKSMFKQGEIFSPDDIVKKLAPLFPPTSCDPERFEWSFRSQLEHHPHCVEEIIHQWFLANAARIQREKQMTF